MHNEKKYENNLKKGKSFSLFLFFNLLIVDFTIIFYYNMYVNFFKLNKNL